MNTALYCCECERNYNADEIRFFCECGGLLDIKLHDGKLPAGFTKEELDRRAAIEIPGCASGVWRYREMVLPDAGEVVTLNEGNTGLYDIPAAASWAGLDNLQVKHEGENPTGSFKDRGMTVAVTRAVRQGAKIVACASTGNTSASMASYAARAGLSSLALIPEGKIAFGKLAQSLAYGAVTVEIKGDFDDGMKMIMEATKDGSLYPMNSVNPFRPEGQKTIIWEIFQQRKWDPPDWIVFPAGNLGNYSAFGKAVEQFYEFGLIKKKPRLAGIQAEGANPFYQSYKTGFKEKFKVDAETLATAIRIGNPVNYQRAIRSINWTNGIVAEVSDQEIMDAKNMMDRTGIGAEPASNASIAGIKKLVREKIIKPDESVTAILTGSILKDPDTVIKFHTGKLKDVSSDNANRILSLKPDMKELGKLIDKLANL